LIAQHGPSQLIGSDGVGLVVAARGDAETKTGTGDKHRRDKAE
jgi:hypothetical protein